MSNFLNLVFQPKFWLSSVYKTSIEFLLAGPKFSLKTGSEKKVFVFNLGSVDAAARLI